MYIFFFQAEDGIRDAQESRGLGDVYKRQLSGRMKYLMLFPLIVRFSSVTVGLPFIVIFTLVKCVFIRMSTLLIEPTMTVPFFSSTVTVSFFNFIKNFTSFIFFDRLIRIPHVPVSYTHLTLPTIYSV
eukprot:TRINITY_DN4092_c0_g1_i3.p1 TRINITY_DN4092_c0_g1~~TRINITY_DN4092_c0_g1_i3.p1  ORF type:complete len:128 (-),score=18.51 TRINITY_DN4092_c0_g1_i3:37-420(-)